MGHAITPELKIAAAPALLQRGCVNVIALDEIRTQIGARWERHQQSVWAHLEGLLRQRLGPTDFFVQVDDVTFVICAPSVSQEEAQIFCLRIAHELHNAMLGPCEIGKVKIARVTSASDGMIEVAPITGPELAQLAVRARLEKSGEAASVPPTTVRQTERAFVHKFMPVWDNPKEAITTYRCTSLAELDASDFGDSTARFKLDLAITRARLQYAADMLSEHLARSDRFLVWIPISFELVSSPVGRMEIASLCRGLSSELRPYILFEIYDLPYGVPQSRLAELVGSLRPFCRGVVAQLPARTANYGAYIGVGLHAIGVSLSTAAVADTEMGSEMFKLNLAAQKQRIMSFALDIPNEDLMRTARDLGINLLTSPLIGDLQDAPGPVRRLTANEILRLAA